MFVGVNVFVGVKVFVGVNVGVGLNVGVGVAEEHGGHSPWPHPGCGIHALSSTVFVAGPGDATTT